MPDFLLFEYDRFEPLDIQVANTQKSNSTTIQDISYASPAGGRVPAYLVVPSGSGPFAAIVFVHWGQGNRDEFLHEAMALAGAGIISLCIDAPFARPDFQQAHDDTPETQAVLLKQSIIEARRAVDLLVERTDVDPQRVGYVGHSYGATIGGILAAVEKRARIYVLMGGLPSLADSYSTSQNPEIVQERETIPPEELQSFINIMKPLDTDQYLGYAAPSVLFMQFARQDELVTEEEAERFFKAASEPKTIHWYDSGHEFNTQARLERAEWLCHQLGAEPLSDEILDKLRF
jgi:dienelactone hydrolase